MRKAGHDPYDRIAELESFVRDVRDVAETLEMLGDRWGEGLGEGVKLYASQLRARSERLMSTEAPIEPQSGEAGH